MSLQYRTSLFAFLGITLLWIVVLTRVWAAVYHGRGSVGGFSLHTTVVYLTLGNLQAYLIITPLAHILADRVRTGEVLFDVSRPIGLPGQMLALQAGRSLVQIAAILVVAPLAGLLGGLSAPAGMAAGLLYPLALLFGLLLNTMLALLVGLSAFWTVDNMALATLFRF